MFAKETSEEPSQLSVRPKWSEQKLDFNIPRHRPLVDRPSTRDHLGVRYISRNGREGHHRRPATRRSSVPIARGRGRQKAKIPAVNISPSFKSCLLHAHTFQQIDLNPSLHSFRPCSPRRADWRSEAVSLPRNRISHLFLHGVSLKMH